MARGRGVAVLGPRLGIRGLTRGMWDGNSDIKYVWGNGVRATMACGKKFLSSCAADVQLVQFMVS